MNTYIKQILFLLFFINGIFAFAHEPIDAMKYRLQKRPQRIGWNAESFFDHTFVSAGFGTSSVISPGGTNEFQLGPTGFLSLGKWFSPFSGLRLSIEGSAYHLFGNQTAKKVAMWGVSAEYLFNFNNLRYDHKADRKFECDGGLGAA